MIYSELKQLREMLEKEYKKPMNYLNYISSEEDKNGDRLIWNQQLCEKLRGLGFDEKVKFVIHNNEIFEQLSRDNWNDFADDVYSCPSYRKAILWVEKKLKKTKNESNNRNS